MRAYLITLLSASVTAVLVSILAPDGLREGIRKHVRLIAALFLLCVMLSPLKELPKDPGEGLEGLLQLPDGGGESDYREEMESALTEASLTYFVTLLTESLESEFQLSKGEVRCAVRWEQNGDEMAPAHVTLLLSGKAILKDPRPMEDYVTRLLGCSCDSALA